MNHHQNLGKICAQMCVHKAKMCTHACCNFAHSFMPLACIFSIYLQISQQKKPGSLWNLKLKVMTLSCTINTIFIKFFVKACARACFCFVCMRMCTDLYQNLSLVCHELVEIFAKIKRCHRYIIWYDVMDILSNMISHIFYLIWCYRYIIWYDVTDILSDMMSQIYHLI